MKHFQNIFRKNNLNIIVKCNLKIVDYLDVTLNLSDGSYKPFHKPNSEINYIHRESNHPPNIIKQLPPSVESCLPKLSSDENVFTQAASVYQEPLKRTGYNNKLKYNNSDKYNSNNNNNNNQDNCNSNNTKNDRYYNNHKLKFNHNDNLDNNDIGNNKDNFNSYENKDRNDNNNNNVKFYGNKNRGNNSNNNNYNPNSNDIRDNIKNKDTTTTTTTNNDNIDSNGNNNVRTSKEGNRNIIWFNSAFSKNVATKIGRYSLNLIDKHFPRDHKFHKIFSRYNMEVSYSCLPNIELVINSHNKKILIHLLTAKVEHVTVLIKQTALDKKNT